MQVIGGGKNDEHVALPEENQISFFSLLLFSTFKNERD